MIRRYKLRREKRRVAAKLNNNNEETSASASASATASVLVSVSATATVSRRTLRGTVNNEDLNTDTYLDFPQSKFYLQACQLLEVGKKNEAIHKCMQGAKVYGCIYSMFMIATANNTSSNLKGRMIHLGVPWFLEGSIRGDVMSVKQLIGSYCQAKPRQPLVLMSYWLKLIHNYIEWSGLSNADTDTFHSKTNRVKDNVERRCAICKKLDTQLLTTSLRQCIGCSTCRCYCSKECECTQIQLFKRYHKPRAREIQECQQVKILEQYHEPYAKEIRDAAICGETHPAIEILRYKLGLTQSIEEYQELCDGYTKNEEKQIDPFAYLVARDDGTVWIGSTLNLLGPSSVRECHNTE